MTRWFRRFGSRLFEQLNFVAGAVGVGALVLTLAGFLRGGGTKTALIVIGSAIALIMLGVGVYRAWPPKARRPADAVGTELPLAELQSFEPRISALGILGAANVGKSTLKNRILHEPSTGLPQTQKITLRISLLGDSTTYVALVDGRGEALYQQFEIARNVDILLVLLDHNDLPNPSTNRLRLDKHEEYGEQLRGDLTSRTERPGPIHLLLNKSDLWRQASAQAVGELEDFFEGEVVKWRTAFGADKISFGYHSNDSPEDIANLVAKLKERMQEVQV